MILFDTNVVIDARNASEANHAWAKKLIEEPSLVKARGINAVTLAELWRLVLSKPADIEPEIENSVWKFLICPQRHRGFAVRLIGVIFYARRASGGGHAPRIPLPDFFIGAHAETMRWQLATRDGERIAKYFRKWLCSLPKNELKLCSGSDKK